MKKEKKKLISGIAILCNRIEIFREFRTSHLYSSGDTRLHQLLLDRQPKRLFITPSKESVQQVQTKIRETIKKCNGRKTEDMIRNLNPIIRGWAYYHRFVHSYRAFWAVDTTIFQALRRWTKRRHPDKSFGWIIKNYFNSPNRKWGFCCYVKNRRNQRQLLEFIFASSIKIVQYIKIKGESNPFDPIYDDYFKMRREFNNYRHHKTNNLTVGLQ